MGDAGRQSPVGQRGAPGRPCLSQRPRRWKERACCIPDVGRPALWSQGRRRRGTPGAARQAPPEGTPLGPCTRTGQRGAVRGGLLPSRDSVRGP